MTSPSILRRLFDAVGLFSFLNLLALVALAYMAASSGAIDRAKLQQMVAIVRGDAVVTDVKDAGGPQTNSSTAQAAAPVRDRVVESDMDKEILRRESERIKAELDQRLALNNSILLRVSAEREKFARAREQEEKAQQVRQERRDAEGFRKQVEIFEALSPKIAVQHLMSLENPEEAARLLVEMDTRKAKKLIEAAKSDAELSRMHMILQLLREVAPERSAELENEP